MVTPVVTRAFVVVAISTGSKRVPVLSVAQQLPGLGVTDPEIEHTCRCLPSQIYSIDQHSLMLRASNCERRCTLTANQ